MHRLKMALLSPRRRPCAVHVRIVPADRSSVQEIQPMTRLPRLSSRVPLPVLLLIAPAIVFAAPDARAAAPVERTHTLPQRRAAADPRLWVGDLPIHVDRRTGRARKPTAGEAGQLVAWLHGALDRPSADPQPVARPDGIRQVRLEGRLGSVVLARPRGDGTLETRCVTTFDAAVAFLGLHPLESAAAPEQ
jgi:hypothetical protein